MKLATDIRHARGKYWKDQSPR